MRRATRVGDQLVRGVELQPHAGQRRTDPVVQLAAQPAALLLAGGDERLAAALQRPRYSRSAASAGATCVGERGEQVAVAGVEHPLARPGGHGDAADRPPR